MQIRKSLSVNKTFLTSQTPTATMNMYTVVPQVEIQRSHCRTRDRREALIEIPADSWPGTSSDVLGNDVTSPPAWQSSHPFYPSRGYLAHYIFPLIYFPTFPFIPLLFFPSSVHSFALPFFLLSYVHHTKITRDNQSHDRHSVTKLTSQELLDSWQTPIYFCHLQNIQKGSEVLAVRFPK
jgi:hypothetical protein